MYTEWFGICSLGLDNKVDICHIVWELLTTIYKLDPKTLYVEYFGGDSDARKQRWIHLELPEDHAIKSTEEDKFKEFGEKNPCADYSTLLFHPSEKREDNLKDDRLLLEI